MVSVMRDVGYPLWPVVQGSMHTVSRPKSSPTSKGARSRRNPVDPNAPRLIKKYPNRRLYDTSASSYITLEEVRRLVMMHDRFEVRDAKTDEDLTRATLMQIILEQEAAGIPMFSERALADIIRFYGHAMQGFMGSYLEKNIQAFVEIQNKLAEQSHGWTPEMWSQFARLQGPMMQGVMGNYLEQSKASFMQLQEQMTQQTEQLLAAFGIRR